MYDYEIKAEEVKSISGGNGDTAYGKYFKNFLKNEVIKDNSKITVIAKGKHNRIIDQKVFDTSKNKKTENTISNWTYNRKLYSEGEIQKFLILIEEIPNVDSFMVDDKSNKMSEVERLRRIISGLESKIEQLSKDNPKITYDPEASTFEIHGLNLVKGNKKSMIFEDSNQVEYVLRVTERVNGTASGKRIPIVVNE